MTPNPAADPGADAEPGTPDGVRARALARSFETEFGALPSGVWAAPGRVNLIGEHTDYNAGLALPLALRERTWVALRPRPDGRVRLRSRQAGAAAELDFDQIAPGRVQGWAAYVAGAAWAAQRAGARASGFEALVDSDVPIGAGLSSSAALSCASVLGLAEIWGLEATRVALAHLAQRAETEIAGVPCGLMDQLTSLCAEPGCALAIDFQTLALEPLAMPLDEAGLALLVIDTRQPHALVEGAYRARREACARAAEQLGVASLREATLETLTAASTRLGSESCASETLRRARHVITENQRVVEAVSILRAAARDGQSERLAALGPLLRRSHASLRDDFEVSVPALDAASASAEAAGALGARLVGGGFGGSVLALVPNARVAAVSEAVTAAFRSRGWAAPGLLSAVPSAGAARIL